jgi:hypothetical protein
MNSNVLRLATVLRFQMRMPAGEEKLVVKRLEACSKTHRPGMKMAGRIFESDHVVMIRRPRMCMASETHNA